MADGGRYSECADCHGKGTRGVFMCGPCQGSGRVRTGVHMMKVAVVGMLKRQEGFIKSSDYPHLDVRFANKGKKYGLSEDFSKYDRILVMSKFVSHSLTDNLDRSKTTLVHGGFGKMRDILHTLNTAARIGQPVDLGLDESDIAEEEESDMTNRMDFSALKDAKVGDVLTYSRPPRMTLASWELRIQQVRSYYKTRFGRVSEVEHKDGKVNIMVTELIPPKRRGKDWIEPKLPERPTSKALEQPSTRLPAPVLASEARSMGMDRKFWADVFLASMATNPGSPCSVHAAVANAALDDLWAKLGHA